MKKKLLTMLVCGSTLPAISADALADVTDQDAGTVRFVGALNAGACNIAPDSLDQMVEMGSIATNSIQAAGDTTSGTTFNIQLANCDATTYKNATVSFNGTTVSGNNQVLAVDNSLAAGSAVATNVGLQIFNVDNTSTAMAVDGSEQSSAATLTSGGAATLKFMAKYLALADNPGAGVANTNASFSVTYY